MEKNYINSCINSLALPDIYTGYSTIKRKELHNTLSEHHFFVEYILDIIRYPVTTLGRKRSQFLGRYISASIHAHKFATEAARYKNKDIWYFLGMCSNNQNNLRSVE